MLRFKFSLIFLLLLNSLVAEEYKLVWSQEFNDSELDSRWNYFIGDLKWNNNLQYFSRDNISIDDGKLIITAKKEEYRGNKYTSGALRTIEWGDWLYGKIEVRAKVPSVVGLLPAIWLKPTDNEYGIDSFRSGEIDILEHVGYEEGFYRSTLHTYSRNLDKLNAPGTKSNLEELSKEFHTYSIVWSEDKIVFLLDNIPYYTFKNDRKGYESWPFDKRFHLILSLAVGGDWAGAEGVMLDQPVDFEIDWIKVYQTPSQMDLNRKLYKDLEKDKDELLLRSKWTLYASDGAEADLTINKDSLELDINKIASKSWNIELSQKGINLVPGRTYRLEFDATSNNKRIYCGIGLSEEPYTHFGGREFIIFLDKRRYSLIFKSKVSEENGRVFFNLGERDEDITLSNISLKQVY